MQSISNEPVSMENYSSIENINYLPLAKKYPIVCLFSSQIFWVIVLAILTGLDIFKPNTLIPTFVYILIVGLALLSGLLSYFGALAKGYVVREKDILTKRGIFWKKQTLVSFKRIQHMDLTHGPIDRKFGFATLKIFTAGGATADLSISGIEHDKAKSIRQLIVEKTGLSDTEQA